MGLNLCPSIWQSHINVILDCLQSKKYCEAILGDLLFMLSKSSHMAKLEDLLKALLKNGLKYPQRNANYLEQICTTWEMRCSYRTKEFVLSP